MTKPPNHAQAGPQPSIFPRDVTDPCRLRLCRMPQVDSSASCHLPGKGILSPFTAPKAKPFLCVPEPALSEAEGCPLWLSLFLHEAVKSRPARFYTLPSPLFATPAPKPGVTIKTTSRKDSFPAVGIEASVRPPTPSARSSTP